MEHNGYYASDPKHKRDNEDRGGNLFAGIVITIVIALLALLIVGLVWPTALGGTMPDYSIIDMTPTPEAGEDAIVPPVDSAEATATPQPTATPFVPDQDRQMPNLDGYEATAQIRNSEKPDAVTIPIIAITAHSFESDITKALSSGMNAHISKPINVDDMFKTLHKYI